MVYLDNDILGIDLINDLGMSYNAKTQQVFAISQTPETLVATSETNIQPLSMAIIHSRYTGHLNSVATHLVTILSTQNQHLQGGPALVKFNNNNVCQLAITNTALYPVMIGQS